MDKCFVCRNDAKNVTEHLADYNVDCPRCGKFMITEEVIDKIISPEGRENNHQYILSYWIKQNQNDNTVRIDSNLFKSIIDHIALPNPREISENLILLIGKRQNNRHQQSIELDIEYISSDIGAIDNGEVNWIAAYLLENKYIHYQNSADRKYLFRLELKGWSEYEELIRRGVETKNAFLAIQYNDNELDDIYKYYFKPAVDLTGFNLIKLVEKPSAGLIDNNLRYQIKQYRFLLADLTYNNRNVYWEAGYAEGLVKPVIYLCEKRSFSKAKKIFDTNHHTTIIYDKNDENNIKEKMENLKATIRNTLPDAKQTDK